MGTFSSTERLPDEFLKESETHSIFLNPATETEIFNIVNNLKNKKSSGHDGISNKEQKEQWT